MRLGTMRVLIVGSLLLTAPLFKWYVTLCLVQEDYFIAACATLGWFIMVVEGIRIGWFYRRRQ